MTHDYYDPMNSSLFCVLHTRVGIPITLSIVMASVAARAGLEMEFINTPGHFRCGVRDENYVDPRKPGTNPRNVVFTSDPFDEGLDATDPRKLWTIDWHRLEEDAGISADKLLPSARDVVMRMMNNLFLIYHNHEANSDDPISRRIRRTRNTTEYARIGLVPRSLRTGGWFDTPSSRSRNFW